jgi:hypothetical protein
MTVQPGLELPPDMVNVVGANNAYVIRMYLVYVNASLVPYVAIGLDIAVKCIHPHHLVF